MAHLAGDLRNGPRTAVLCGWAIVLAGLVVYAAHVGLGLGTSPLALSLLDGWLYSSLTLAGALGVLARAILVREDGLAWALIGIAALLWVSGDIYYWRVLSQRDEVPYPSIADGLYIAFYPALYAGLVCLVRSRVRRFHASQWLDGLAAALLVGAVGATALMPPIIAGNEGASTSAVATNLAYPLGDLLVLGLLAALAGLMGWRPGRAVGLLAVGCLTFSLADSVYLFQVAAGTYAEGGLLDLFWPVGMLCMALAAWQPPTARHRGAWRAGACCSCPARSCSGRWPSWSTTTTTGPWSPRSGWRRRRSWSAWCGPASPSARTSPRR